MLPRKTDGWIKARPPVGLGGVSKSFVFTKAAVANTHPANLGDVAKHLILCAAIEAVAPARYFESHGGRATYDLAGIHTGTGGIWDFLLAAPQSSPLGDGTYACLERASAGTRQSPGTYLGSTALADALLPGGSSIHVAEINPESAGDLETYLVTRGRQGFVHSGDGVDFVCNSAQSGDMVLLDPFDVTGETSPEGRTSATAFSELANRGVTTFLWYAITERHWRLDWPDDLATATERLLWRMEMRLPEASAGLLGCGMLAANIRGGTESVITWVALQLAHALSPRSPGLRSEVASPEIAPNAELWNPYGAARPTAADVRALVARVGFPLIILDKDGEAWTRPALASEVSVYDEPGQPPKLVLRDGNDRPTTLTAVAIRGTQLVDDHGDIQSFARAVASD